MVEKMELHIGNRVAVIGGIGQLVAQIARISGASSVTLIEPVEGKRKLAESVGIDYTIDPMNEDQMARAMEITDGRGFDNIVETSGNAKAAENALAILATGGHIVFPAMYNMQYNLPLNLYHECYLKEKTIHGCLMSPYSFPRTIQMLPRLQFKPLIQSVHTLEEYNEAYADAISGKFIKVVFGLTH